MANRSPSPSITDTIGNTPLVELRRTVRILGLQGRLLAKLEYFNPGFSKKDRVALEMIREARRDGSLRPGQTVVELTSGNTGTGLAIVCRALGHPFVAVMSRGNTPERARMMRWRCGKYSGGRRRRTGQSVRRARRARRRGTRRRLGRG